jgi:hypothetical protein
VYQQLVRPEHLFGHIFGNLEGYLVTFTGRQARFACPDARPNELADIRQRSWRYPIKGEKAAEYLVNQAQLECDTYFAVHLFREPGNRLAANALLTVRTLWLDEDGGEYPEEGPEPTAIVHSSAKRRHLYWQLTHPVSVEWAVGMNRRLAAWAKGDTGKAGLASVLRAAGTANYKRHPQVDLVGGWLTGASAWEPEVMDQAVPTLPEPARKKRAPYDGPEVELEPYLERVEVLEELPDGLGVKYAIVCPWVHEHSGGDRTGTRLGQRRDGEAGGTGGALWFCCDHDHCQGRTWYDFKKKILPGFRLKITRPGYTGNMEVKVNHV